MKKSINETIRESFLVGMENAREQAKYEMLQKPFVRLKPKTELYKLCQN